MDFILPRRAPFKTSFRTRLQMRLRNAFGNLARKPLQFRFIIDQIDLVFPLVIKAGIQPSASVSSS